MQTERQKGALLHTRNQETHWQKCNAGASPTALAFRSAANAQILAGEAVCKMFTALRVSAARV